MKCSLVLLFASVTVLSGVAAAQTDTNPSDQGYATFGNKQPLIKKKEKAPTSRTLSGKVVDEIGGTPLKGAIVTLTDLSTHQQRSTITKDDGRYVFDDLSFTIDYELKARYKNASTDVRKISQYDHAAKVVRILTVPDTSTPAPFSEAQKDPAKK